MRQRSKIANIFSVILFTLCCSTAFGSYVQPPRTFIGQQVSEISTFYAPAGGSATAGEIAWFGDVGNAIKGFLLGLVQNHAPGAVKNGVEAEEWVQDIAENLFPDNEAYLQSKDDTPFLKGKTVHLPQSGTTPAVTVNRAVFPATAAQRTDSEETYDVDEFSTDPVHLQKTEEEVVTYEKRQSILSDHLMTLRTTIADKFANIWSPTAGAANQVRTTGSTIAALGAAQTGNRKLVTQADLANLARILDNMDVPDDGNRVLWCDANMYNAIRNIDNFMTAEKIGAANIIKGQIGTIFNFRIFKRSRVTRYDNTGTPVKKAYGAANAATDNLASLAWHPSFVRRALGNADNGGIIVFANEADATYYGDVFSALVRAGGRIARTDQKGVVALIETTV